MFSSTSKLYWNEINMNCKNYPMVNKNQECEVLVVGGGITGCLTCYYLSQYNIDTILVEKNIIATPAMLSSACLLPGSDEYFSDLINTLGEDKALRLTKLCQKSLDEVQKITYSINRNCDFRSTKAIYLSKETSLQNNLLKEFNFKNNNTLPVDFLNTKINNIPAIYSCDSGVLDPIKFCHALIKASTSKGVKVYEKSPVKNYYVKNGINNVNFAQGNIKCKKVIYTTSTNSMYISNKFSLKNYPCMSIVSNSFSSLKDAKKFLFIIETLSGPIFIRITEDNRLLSTFYKKIFTKENNLSTILNHVKSIFPEFSNLKIEYKWQRYNMFTNLGLPIIGESKDFKGFFYNLPYGINKIIYSVIGASIIKDIILYNNNPDIDMFNSLL